MITNERYETIKKWGNYLFLFNRKEANAENKVKLKNILKKILLTEEFDWKTDKLTGIIHIHFVLGEIQVKIENGMFCVSMDADTNRKLREFKTDTNQPVHKEEEHQVREEETKEITHDEKPALSERTEQENQHKEEPKPSEINQEMKKEEKEEEFEGESVFLGFLD